MNINDLRESVGLLEAMAPYTLRKKRMSKVERLTDEYVESTGRVPDDAVLERMSNLILHEELSDTHPDKITRNDYPILSERQYNARVSGEQRRRRKDGTTITEVPLSQARNKAQDGKDYSLPIRRVT